MVASGRELRLERALAAYLEARSLSLAKARTALGLGELDVKALHYVLQHPGCRPSTLRVYLGITSAGVTTLIDRLIDRGAVSREADPDDRRATLLRVVADLSQEPWSALTRFDDGMATAFGSFDATQRDHCADVIERATAAAFAAIPA